MDKCTSNWVLNAVIYCVYVYMNVPMYIYIYAKVGNEPFVNCAYEFGAIFSALQLYLVCLYIFTLYT